MLTKPALFAAEVGRCLRSRFCFWQSSLGGVTMLFHHLFATMNEVLDEILQQYPTADSSRKAELNEQLAALRKMSDAILEEWLRFEEKMGKLFAAPPVSANKLQASGAVPDSPAKRSDAFVKGQGYYKLLMFKEAVKQFEQVVKQHPDFLLGRIFLAMGYFRLGDYAEAYRHFQLLLPLTDNGKMKAISYNAMGCIQAKSDNMEKACEFFQKAYQSDPTCMDPLVNLGLCKQKDGALQMTADFMRE